MMAEAVPRLAVAMSSVLSDAKVSVVDRDRIDIQFDGLTAMAVNVVRRIVNNRFQMIESQVDLSPKCLSMLSHRELQRLAAAENLGLRGVTLLPLHPDSGAASPGLRIRTGFVGQKGRTTDEVENLAIDILTTITFARMLEDRITASAIAGEFSFELYQSRYMIPGVSPRTRFIAHGQQHFLGSTDRVFGQIIKTLRDDFHFKVSTEQGLLATMEPPGQTGRQRMQIFAQIHNETPVFAIHAPLLKLPSMKPDVIWAMLAELNQQIENGHFEWNPNDQVLSFASWKHLTNDLRNFSFDYVVFSAPHALALALEAVQTNTVIPLHPRPALGFTPLKNAA